MSTSTVRLHRVFAAPPERLWRAFTDPAALAKWLPPHGFYGQVHAMDVRQGGAWRMSFIKLHTGNGHSFGGVYREVVPNERLRYSSVFDDPELPGEMMTTVTLKKVAVGTDFTAVQEGIPPMIPVEACYLGWQQSLMLLAQLAEPEIPG